MKFSLAILFLSLSQQVHVNADQESQCSLYMAPSSTEEEDQFKLGMYAGVDFQPGQVIAAPEIAIPLVHMITHNKNEDPDFFSEHADFMWNRDTIHANFEVFPDADDEARINIAIPGIGAVGNQHITSFENTKFDDEAVLDRIPMTSKYENGSSPYIGASSQYYGVTMKSTRPILAGEELFMNGLGDVEDEEYLLKVEDFESVDDTLKKILDIFSSHKDSIDDKKKQEIYDYVYNVFESSMTKSKSDDDMVEALLSLFPDNATDVERVLEEGGTFVSEFPESRRSIDWLKENGQCSDGLYPGLGADDKGAFSKRDVKKFDLISPSPLMMIQNKDYLSMYETVIDEDRVDVVGEDPVSKQLFINYCLGHPESSLLFYPYGMGVNMINHRPSYAGANAKIVWSKAPFYDAGILDLTVDELVEKYGAVLPLGIDIVATTDIAADEEVFIDYGDEWERAMDKHVMEWDYTAIFPKEAWQITIEREGEPFLSAPEWVDGEKEGLEEPLPEGVTTACHAFGTFNEDEDEDNLPKEGGLLTLEFNAEKTERNGHNFSICEVIGRISRKDSSYLYTVKMLKMSRFNDKDVIIRSVPHSNIRYVDKPYTSSMHRRTFRHPIMLPDKIFPLSWRNIDGES